MIELRKITWDSFDDCLRLKLHPEQENFVASNVYSLAQSYVALLNDKIPPMSYAIYHEDTLIGFTMMYYETAEENEYGDEPCYGMNRFMIDKQYQGKGYGRMAMEKVLEHIRSFPHGPATAMYLSYDDDNVVARRLYASYGFVETGERNSSDEVIAKLDLTKQA